MAVRHGDLIITGGGGDRSEDRAVQRRAAAGGLRKVGPGIYAEANGRAIEEIVCGGWAPILAHHAPGAVLHGRSGIRRSPWRERQNDGPWLFPGWLYATDPDAADRRSLSLPGLELRLFPGPGPLEGDIPYLGVHLPSDARVLLENLEPSRSRLSPSRTVNRAGVELAVEQLLKAVHEDGVRTMRALAERIAPALGAEDRLPVLLDIVGKILGTRSGKLASREVAARTRAARPYDPECLERIKSLATSLGRISATDRPDPHAPPAHRACASFVEAYFTNYIEGTRFLVEKARRIVFDNEDPDGRPQDGRDVTQTYAQVAALGPGSVRASTAAEFLDEIRERNRLLLDARPDKRPGLFKVDANMAGNTVFVAPSLVEGTLREGFQMLRGITQPFARAVFTHALVVLVHPFDDGNGRTSRIMMTKELVAAGQARVVVPTIFRTDYIDGLRALTAVGKPRPAPLIQAMLRCQEVTSQIASGDLDETLALWASTHAFLEDERDARLTRPDPQAEIVWRKGVPAPASYWADVDLRAQLADDDDAAATLGF